MQFWNWKKNLEDTVKTAPTIENYTALVKSLKIKGDVAKAWEYIEQAKQKFPKVRGIVDLYISLARVKWRPEIERLKKLIHQGVISPALVQLAEIYKELGEEEEALSLCLKAIENSPNDDTPHYILGQIRLGRFYKDFLERDGLIAREHLEKSFEINPQHYKSLLALAKFYLQVGAIKKAQQRLSKILTFAPEDENIHNLISICNEVEKSQIEDIEILLSSIEQDRKLFYDLEGSRQKREIIISPDVFQNALDSLATVLEIECLLICDEEGILIAHYAQENVDFNIYYEVSVGIHQNVQHSSRQMDIGKFQRSEISGLFGCIQMIAVNNILYTAFGSSETKSNLVYRKLQNFISQVPTLHENE